MEYRKCNLSENQESAPGLWSWHVPSDQVTLSEESYRIYGIDADTFRGTFAECMAVVHPDDRAQVEQVAARAVSEKRGLPIEFRILRGGTDERLIRAVADVFLSPSGQVERMAGMVQDVTAPCRAKRESAELTMAMEHLAEAVLIMDAAGRVRYANSAFERITGHRREDLLDKEPVMFRDAALSDASSGAGAVAYDEMRAALARGEAWAGRLRGQRANGSSFLVETTVSPIRDPRLKAPNFVAVLRDVTHEVALEEQLSHVQKMEAVGMLAGGIAHDFNNILLAINGHSDLLLMKSPIDPDVGRHAREIRKAGERARDLTSQLLAFGRKQILRPCTLDLRDVINDMDSLLERVIGDEASLEVSVGEEAATIWADPGQMEQVVLNLATNARDAMPAGGAVRIGLSIEELGHEGCEVPGALEPGPHVLLRVRDGGLGMDAATRARIFEPFFSTKSLSLGTGLGLATVYGIVRQSGGHIHVHSEVGQGTTFEVCLPFHRKSAEESGCPTAPSAGTAGQETILVAEDEPLVASIVKNTLRAQGYTILSAEDGVQALELAAAHKGPIDLLFTDVVMPRMDGVELAARLRRARPGVRVLFSSGYAGSALIRRGAVIDDDELLQKPYAPDALIARVRQALDAEQPRASLTG